MASCVVMGASIKCSFGAAPSSLMVLPVNMTTATFMPVATTMDYVPMLNILPFGVCNSLANPTVASATAAALGVLTPMPCIPVVVAPWTPGSTNTTLTKKPALTDSSQCMCMWGGAITISSPGQSVISVK